MSEKTINSNVAQKTITKIPKEHMQEDERQGLNGYRKTDLDLEIERELREMMDNGENTKDTKGNSCLLYTSPSPRDRQKSRMPSSA